MLTQTQEAPAVGESSFMIGSFVGNNFRNTPAELASNVVCNRLEATAGGMTHPPRWYEFNLPVPSGTDIQTQVENVDSNAGNTEFVFDVIWSDSANGTPMNRLFARETIITTTIGLSIVISEGARVTDYSTVVVPGGTLVADEEESGRISATSTGFGIVNTLTQSYMVQPIEATSGSSNTWVNYSNLDLPITQLTSTVTSSLSQTSAPTNPSQWLYGIGYQPIRLGL